jgi:hypothetical protein
MRVNDPFKAVSMPTRTTSVADLVAVAERQAPRLVVLMLAIQTGLLAHSAWCHSPTVDEVAHLPAGTNIWQNGRFDLYHVNPPLIKALAAAPVLLAQPKTNWKHWNQRPGGRSEWIVGRDFFLANKQRTFQYFTWARWACLPLMWLGGWTCFRWAREWYGPLGGLLAASLWCSCPNLLAHGAMITPDAGAAALGVWGSYQYWKWLSQPTWGRACWAGLGLGLAVLTKTTWLLLFGLWPLLFVWWRWLTPATADRSRGWGYSTLQLALLLFIGLDVLNLGFLFEGTGRPLREFRFVSRSLAGPDTFDRDRQRTGNRFRETWLGSCPVPVPAAFLQGIDLQKHDFEVGKLCYLGGEFQEGGWWYFYLYAWAVKTPIGTLLLAVVALGSGWMSRRLVRRRELVLLAPAALLFAVVSAETGFTIFLRYVLPATPFVLIWLGRAAEWGRSGPPGAGWLVAGCVCWSVNSSLGCHPHSLSYFNELAGGPRGGPAHLLDGNVDWGQDLLHLKRWLRHTPAARPLQLAYYGQVNPRHAAIEFSLPAKGPDLAAAARWAAEDRRWSQERDGLLKRIETLQQASGWRPPEPNWAVPRVQRVESENEASFTVTDRQVISLSQAASERDAYTVTLATQLSSIAGFKVEVQPDPDQAFRTVGRAENGNFVLAELTLEIQDAAGATRTVGAWRRATADWSQEHFPVGAAIDGDPTTGWAVFPFVTEPHVATFELSEPLTVGLEERVVVRLVQPWGKRHLWSRWRMWLAGDTPAVERWPDWLLRPESEQSPEELARRESLVLSAPPELARELRELIACGTRRPQAPADWSQSWLAPGWYAVSVNFVRGYPGKGWSGDGRLLTFERSAFEYFRELEPVATAGYSIYLYHVTLADANRLRARHGLPLFSPAAVRE